LFILENLIPISDKEIENIRFLKTKRLTIVICGQNVLAKSVIANELLAKQLLPFQIDNLLDEKWRIIKIKFSRSSNYTFQLIDSDFELMSSSDLKKPLQTNNNGTNGGFHISIDDLRIEDQQNIENQAIIEIGVDSKLLEYECDIIIYSNTMQKSIFEKLSQNIIPIYIYAIIDNQLDKQVFIDVIGWGRGGGGRDIGHF
jgi:septin family protein